MSALSRCHWPFLLLLLLGMQAAQAKSVQIELADGAPLVKLSWNGDEVKVKDPQGETLIKGKGRDAGGRKYKRTDGVVIAKVNGDDDSFKLKTESGALLWKVKNNGDKIKISANEDNAFADELKRKSPTKWELSRSGRAIGKVVHYPDRKVIKVKDADGTERYRVRGEPFSPLYGVLAINGIRDAEAFIIMAEMWLRGW